MTMTMARKSWVLFGGVAFLASAMLWAQDESGDKVAQRATVSASSDVGAESATIRSLVALLLSKSVNAEEMGTLATAFDVPIYSVLPSGVSLAAGEIMVVGMGESDLGPIGYPDVLRIGETVKRGLLLNIGSDPAVLRFPANNDSWSFDVMVGEMVIIGDFVEDAEAKVMAATFVPANSCSVPCASGFYGCCCCIAGSGAVCSCVNFNNPPHCNPCQAGGPGSTGCSINCMLVLTP